MKLQAKSLYCIYFLVYKYMPMSKRIADLLFPHVSSDLTLLKQQYPDRKTDQMVVRFGPSPTGMMHI